MRKEEQSFNASPAQDKVAKGSQACVWKGKRLLFNKEILNELGVSSEGGVEHGKKSEL